MQEISTGYIAFYSKIFRMVQILLRLIIRTLSKAARIGSYPLLTEN